MGAYLGALCRELPPGGSDGERIPREQLMITQLSAVTLLLPESPSEGISVLSPQERLKKPHTPLSPFKLFSEF